MTRSHDYSRAMFRLASVTKRYADTNALIDVTLDVPQGQTTVLIGPSGCGKSTLLRVMLGLIQPTSGSVKIDETHGGQTLPARTSIGYVIQDGGLFPHLTCRRNVTLMAREIGRPRADIETRLSELTALTNFPTGALDRYPAELSGGQRQRVALMRALMLDPPILLMDEPLGALDPMIRFDLQNDLRQIFRALGKTVVMVTHDLAEASFFADLIVLMRDGKIVQSGTLQNFTQHPAEPFVTQFINAQRETHFVENA